MNKFELFVFLLVLGLSAVQSLEEEEIVSLCKPGPAFNRHKSRRSNPLYDPRSSKCKWSDSAPDGYEVRFVCREVLIPEDVCDVKSQDLLKEAGSRGLINFSCGKEIFNVFSNGPVLKLKFNTSEVDERAFRCDLEAVPEKKADCNCKCNGESSYNDYSCLAAVLKTKQEEVKCPGNSRDKQYHLASGFCEINLTADQIDDLHAKGDAVIRTTRHAKSKFVSRPLYRLDYDITLVALKKDAKLNWNMIPLCLQGNFNVNNFDGELTTVPSEESEAETPEMKAISKGQCSTKRLGAALNEKQICTLNAKFNTDS